MILNILIAEDAGCGGDLDDDAAAGLGGGGDDEKDNEEEDERRGSPHPPDPHHSHREERQVPREGVRRPDRGEQLSAEEEEEVAIGGGIGDADEEVMKKLRDLGEPICLFGEGPADRERRLMDLVDAGTGLSIISLQTSH